MSADYRKEKEHLRTSLNDFLKSNAGCNREFRQQLRKLESVGSRAYLFGGFVRDIYQSGSRAAPKDVDIVFEGEAYDQFLASVHRLRPRTNRFGGVNFQMGGVDVDAWRLEDTWAFRNGYFADRVGVRTLPKTTYLSLDAIALQMWPEGGRARKVYDSGFFQTMECQLLDVNLEENPFPELMVVRTLYMAKRNQFALSGALQKALHALILHCGIRDLHRVQIAHYKKAFLSMDELKEVAEEVMRRVNLGIRQAYQPFPEYSQDSLGFPSQPEQHLMGRLVPGVQLSLL